MFIDVADIAAKNPGLTGSQDLYFSFNPPYGNGEMVRWSCKSGDLKPVCSQVPDITIGQTFTNTVIVPPIQVVTPNTAITVRDSAGQSIGRGAWVTIFKNMTSGNNTWQEWVANSETDANGRAVFNLEDTGSAVRYVVEVNAPWNQRQEHAQKKYTNLAYSALNNQAFNLASPNLKLTIKQPSTGRVSQWSSVQIEEVGAAPNYNPVSWVAGFGTDELGRVSMNLANSKIYRLTVYPGFGSKGTTTRCIVETDGSGTVSAVSGQCAALGAITAGVADLTLSAGNVTGRIYKNDAATGAEGAIVFAEAFDGNGNAISGKTVEGLVDEQGAYGVQLDPNFTWKIKVFYVNKPGETQLASLTTAQTVNFVAGSAIFSVNLEVKP
jgi:hypothetical protein